MKIGKLLRKAAEKHLSYDHIDRGRTNEFICHAISTAVGENCAAFKRAVSFLEELGMPLDGNGFSYWDTKCGAPGASGIPRGGPRQELRYAWLQLAADIAEEEGL